MDRAAHVARWWTFDVPGGPFQLTIDDRPAPIYDSGISMKASRKTVKTGGTATFTTTVTNTGTVPIPEEWVNLTPTKAGREYKGAKKVRYLSLKTTRGKCKKQKFRERRSGHSAPSAGSNLARRR